jgi:hypothetical protein
MRKGLALIFVILIVLLCGCLANEGSNDAALIQAVNALDVDSIEYSALVEKTTCDVVASSKDNIAMPLSFDISDKTYCLGMVCEKMLSDFEIVEIIGYRFDDGYVPIGGQVILTLCDKDSGNFTVTVQNRMNKAAKLDDCIVYEVVIENTKGCDLSIVKVSGVAGSNSSLGRWIIAFGDDYTKNVESYWTSYSWNVEGEYLVNISIDSNTNDVISVHMATN